MAQSKNSTQASVDQQADNVASAQAPKVAPTTPKKEHHLPHARTPMQWVAWLLNRTAAFVRWVIGTAVPLYLVIGTICVIAIPKDYLPSPFASTRTATTTSFIGQTDPSTLASVSSNTTANEPIKITEIAKMTIDATKERIDMMKENYDKLFSLIAALGALLAFFGFKGVETFISTRAKAEETVEKAEAAIAKAKAAQETAEEAVDALNNFMHTKYKKDNAAELNVSQSIILRELADMYQEITKKVGPMDPKDSVFRDYLLNALHYIDKVTDNPEGIDVKILARAFVVRGNILSRLFDVTGALKMCEMVFEKYVPNDHSALFNGACYACRLARDSAAADDHRGAARYETKALSYLKRAIELEPDCRGYALTDKDFEYFREKKNSQFLACMSPTP